MYRLSTWIATGYLLVCAFALVATITLGPIGYAPLRLPIGAAGTPVRVTIWYGTEKQAWLEEAARRFAATRPAVNGRPVEVELIGVGSREIAVRTARQEWGTDAPPVAISPASSLWVEVLKTDWAARNGTPIVSSGVHAPQPLVITPLVLVAWEERAQAVWPDAPMMFWHDLHRVLADPQGWAAVGRPEWGLVKFGHTSPLTSNSGAQTLLLMAYGYHQKQSGLTNADVLDPGFQEWMREVETAVLEFGDSTGTFMENMVRFGPSKYDFVVVYENLAIDNIEAAQGRWGQNIRIYYPPATILSDHPYAILDAPWTTPEQQAAAAAFRDFLLARPQQELALQYGFRPADPDVAIVSDDPANPFNRFRSYGVQIDIAQQVEVPPGDVITTLLDLWRRQIGS